MRLTITMHVEDDRLDVPQLLFALPLALDAVQRATSAGVAATGPDGMTVQPPGLSELVKVRFRVETHETVERLPSGAGVEG